MYAEAGLLFPRLQLQGVGFTNHQPQQQEEELRRRLSGYGLLDDDSISHQSGHSHLPITTPALTSNLVRTSSIYEYYLGGEGDLFNAPHPIIEEEPHLELDPMVAAISMISAGEDITSTEAIKVADSSSISEYFLGGVDLFKAPESILKEPQLELDPMTAAISMISDKGDITSAEAMAFDDIASIDSEKLLDDFFYDCKKDLLENCAIENSHPGNLDVDIQTIPMEEDQIIQKDNVVPEGSISKSVSMECLISEEWTKAGGALTPNFLDFREMDFGAAFGMRRAYSEGDIKTLSNGSLSNVSTSVPQAPIKWPLSMDSYRMEERQEKLSRYRRKKTMRNFGRKIKYACRKALADSQPRVRGRFAKTDKCEIRSQLAM